MIFGEKSEDGMDSFSVNGAKLSANLSILDSCFYEKAESFGK